MNILLRLSPLVTLIGCVSTATQSPSPEHYPSAASPSPPAEHYFDCDVPPGRFSEWSRTVSTRAVRLSGTVELIEPRHDEHWRPVASIYIGGTNSAAGLRAYVDWNSPDMLHFVLAGPGASGPSSPAVVSVPWQRQVTPFSVSLSESGELKVSAGSGAQTLHLKAFEVRSIQLACSTAQFKFRGVIVGGT